MKISRLCALAIAAATLCVTGMASAEETAKPETPVKGEVVMASVEVTAQVTKIDHKTREVTLKTEDGKEYNFVADAAVKNLDQVNKGDLVTITYTEAVAYELNKSAKALGVEATAGAKTAEPGAKPAAAIGQKVKMTVEIAAIDTKVPSVTFKGPAGNTRTIKVQHPEKLEGVKVGDTVDITYAEAIAVKVEKKAPEKK